MIIFSSISAKREHFREATSPTLGRCNVPSEEDLPGWYAASTSANHEKSVEKQLSVRNIECFLPTYQSLRRWKDRRVVLEMPLFPGYVFVRMYLRDRLRVVQAPGVARLVAFNGKPARLPDNEIQLLKNGLATGVRAEPHRFLTIGRRVRVSRGPLAGMQGILVRQKRHTRFVLSIELIMKSVAVEVDGMELEPADER